MNTTQLYNVLLAPHISEKSSMGAELSGRHTFKVSSDATKLDVKRAVEKLFNVNVKSVQIVNVKGKTKRFKGVMGKRSNFKKAIISLEEGQTIDAGAGV